MERRASTRSRFTGEFQWFKIRRMPPLPACPEARYATGRAALLRESERPPIFLGGTPIQLCRDASPLFQGTRIAVADSCPISLDWGWFEGGKHPHSTQYFLSLLSCQEEEKALHQTKPNHGRKLKYETETSNHDHCLGRVPHAVQGSGSGNTRDQDRPVGGHTGTPHLRDAR